MFWYGSVVGDIVTHECLTVASMKNKKCSRKTAVAALGSIISDKKSKQRILTECLLKTTAVKYIYRGSEIDLTKSVEVFHFPEGKHILCIISVV